MAATSTTIAKFSLSLVFRGMKSTATITLQEIYKKINFWWRGGRRGGNLVQ